MKPIPTTPFVPPAGQEDHYLQYLRDNLTPLYQRIFRRGVKAYAYPAYQPIAQCAVEASLEANVWLHQKEHRHLRAQFICTPCQDRRGRDLLCFERVEDIDKGNRLHKRHPILSAMPEVPEVNPSGTGEYCRVAVSCEALADMLVLSGRKWAVENPQLGFFSFSKTPIPHSNMFSVTGQRCVGKPKLQDLLATKEQSRPVAPTNPIKNKKSNSTKLQWGEHLRSLHHIGASLLMPNVTCAQGPSLRRTLLQWRKRHKPDARYSVKWDHDADAWRVTREHINYTAKRRLW